MQAPLNRGGFVLQGFAALQLSVIQMGGPDFPSDDSVQCNEGNQLRLPEISLREYLMEISAARDRRSGGERVADLRALRFRISREREVADRPAEIRRRTGRQRFYIERHRLALESNFLRHARREKRIAEKIVHERIVQ